MHMHERMHEHMHVQKYPAQIVRMPLAESDARL